MENSTEIKPCKHGWISYCDECHTNALHDQLQKVITERDKYRQEAMQERKLSADIVAEREELIIENERLKLTIQKALSTWERMEDFDDSITVIENMKDNFEVIKQEWTKQEANLVNIIKGVNK